MTLMELLVIILLVAVLVAAIVPIMRGRVNNAKWAEANAAAGTIRDAVEVYYAERGEAPTGSLGDIETLNALDLQVGDLTGTYFVAVDYSIDGVDDFGRATITVRSSLPNAPDGSRTYYPDGTWE